MHRLRLWGAVVLLLADLVLSGSKAFADPQLPPRTGSIVDLADLLEPFQEQPLATQFATLKQRNGVDFVVVTLPSLQGYSIESWGRLLGNSWNVGGKSGLGALLIVAPNDREVRIEIGDALSLMFPDRAAAKIIDNEILPSFREGRLSAGILAGANAMIFQVTRPLMAAESGDYSVEGSTSGPAVERPSRLDLDWLRAYLPSQGQVLAGILILFVLFVLYKTKIWRPLEGAAFPDDYSGRTVYRNDQSSIWCSSSWHRRHDHDHDSGGFGGFGISGGSSSSSRSSGSSGSGSSRSSGGFSGSGSSRSFGGSSSSGGSSGRGASGRW